MIRLIFIVLLGSISLSACQNAQPAIPDKPTNNSADTTKAQSLDSMETVGANYTLTELTPDLKQHMAEQLKNAATIIKKYRPNAGNDSYNSETLDSVFTLWAESSNPNKESPEFFVEAIGAAFGQDLVNSLDCEWQILTDQNGTDLTVINRKFKVNSFPLSSAEKAYSENRKDSFQKIKKLLADKINEAKRKGQITER